MRAAIIHLLRMVGQPRHKFHAPMLINGAADETALTKLADSRILKYTRLREIEVGLLSNVIYIHQLMLPSKCFCFKHRCKTAAASLERLKNPNAVFTSRASSALM